MLKYLGLIPGSGSRLRQPPRKAASESSRNWAPSLHGETWSESPALGFDPTSGSVSASQSSKIRIQAEKCHEKSEMETDQRDDQPALEMPRASALHREAAGP